MECYTNAEIMRAVGISEATFYRYKARIFHEYAERFTQQKASDVGFYKQQLHDRLTRYLKILEDKLDKSSGRDAAELARTTMEISKMIFDLNLQGIEILDTVRSLDNKVRARYDFHNLNNNDIKQLGDNNNSEGEIRLLSSNKEDQSQ